MSIKEIHRFILNQFYKKVSVLLTFILCISLASGPSFAAKTSMTGDYANDTISVIGILKEAVETPKDASNSIEVREEALALITDYISRYRNRGMVNKTQSFTTMQTALNAMAGHYKNFASRPLPDKLKERLNKELALAEKMVLRESWYKSFTFFNVSIFIAYIEYSHIKMFF